MSSSDSKYQSLKEAPSDLRLSPAGSEAEALLPSNDPFWRDDLSTGLLASPRSLNIRRTYSTNSSVGLDSGARSLRTQSKARSQYTAGSEADTRSTLSHTSHGHDVDTDDEYHDGTGFKDYNKGNKDIEPPEDIPSPADIIKYCPPGSVPALANMDPDWRRKKEEAPQAKTKARHDSCDVEAPEEPKKMPEDVPVRQECSGCFKKYDECECATPEEWETHFTQEMRKSSIRSKVGENKWTRTMDKVKKAVRINDRSDYQELLDDDADDKEGTDCAPKSETETPQESKMQKTKKWFKKAGAELWQGYCYTLPDPDRAQFAYGYWGWC